MSKFIFTTDWHLCFHQPSCRTDNIFKTQLGKLETLVQLCNQELPDFIIMGGDLFDSPRASDPSVLNDVIHTLKNLKSKLFYIPGSHDIYGYNLDSYKQSFIGTLEESGCINVLLEKAIYKFPTDILVGVMPCQINNTIEDYLGFKDCDIIVTHNMISDISLPYNHILIRDIAQHFNGKIFLCGHLHKPFYIMENNNLFVNTGPLIRTAITEKIIQPHIAVFNKVGSKLDYKDLYLPYSNDSFVEKKETEQTVNISFNDVLKDTDLVFNDIYEVLNHIVEQLHIDNRYADMIKLRLEHATKKLNN